MRKLRKLVGASVFGVLALISAAAAVEVWRVGIPQTTIDDPSILARELESIAYPGRGPEMKMRLARRIEREFVRGTDWQPALSQLSDEEWKRFNENYKDLTWLWLNDKVWRFSRLRRDGEKRRYLEQQMARVRTWPLPRRKPRKEPVANFDIGDQLRGIMMHVTVRLQALTPQERERFEQFARALGMHFATRMQAPPD
ncbi:MAG: hypothetical protein K2Y37_13490 [Pirellulales bacterium]|nr:hypothetical protein [Pirellulales bacterium]